MILYPFDCHKCEISFEEFGRITKPPKRRKCPQCGKQARRAIVAPNFKVSGAAPHKWSKSDVKRMYNEMIDDSKERAKDTKSPYVNYSFDPKAAQEHGARRLTDSEVAEKIETSRKLTTDANKILDNTKT